MGEFGRSEQAVFLCEPERRSGGIQCVTGVQRCGEGCAALKAATTLRAEDAAKLIPARLLRQVCTDFDRLKFVLKRFFEHPRLSSASFWPCGLNVSARWLKARCAARCGAERRCLMSPCSWHLINLPDCFANFIKISLATR